MCDDIFLDFSRFFSNIVTQKEKYQTSKNVDFTRFLKHIDDKKIISVTM